VPKAKPVVVETAAAVAQAARPAQQGSIYSLAAMQPVTANDVISTRGFWRGLPDAAPTDASAARRMDVASAEPQAVAARPPVVTGSVGPNVGPWTKDMPGDIATSYASVVEPKPEPRPARAAPVGTATSGAIPRNTAAAAGTTVALKASPFRSSEIQTAAAPAAPVVTGRASDEPWLRAIIATPSVRAYMTITMLGTADMRALAPLLRKPSAMLAMGFSADPNAGLSHNRFDGAAIVFLASVMPGSRSAALQ
jgi:hypothetical protein